MRAFLIRHPRRRMDVCSRSAHRGIRSETTMARRPGFTLVELLVSLAILVVLAATLIPLVGGARAAALKAVCPSRLKDLTSATNQYFHDNQGVYPLQRGTTLTAVPGG